MKAATYPVHFFGVPNADVSIQITRNGTAGTGTRIADRQNDTLTGNITGTFTQIGTSTVFTGSIAGSMFSNPVGTFNGPFDAISLWGKTNCQCWGAYSPRPLTLNWDVGSFLPNFNGAAVQAGASLVRVRSPSWAVRRRRLPPSPPLTIGAGLIRPH